MTTLAPRRKPSSVGRLAAWFMTRTARHVVLLVVAIAWLLPVMGLFFTSLLPAERLSEGGWWQAFSRPSHLSVSNYEAVLDTPWLSAALTTTVWVTLGGAVLPVAIALLAGYALTRLDLPGSDWVVLGVVILMIVPPQMALIPIIRLYNVTNLFDTILGLVLFHTAFGLPFTIFVMTNYIGNIPREYTDAARVDGVSELGIVWRIILPLSLPAVAGLLIIQVLAVWNDLLVGLVLAQSKQPIMAALMSQAEFRGTNFDVIAPGAFLAAIVPAVLFIVFLPYYERGFVGAGLD